MYGNRNQLATKSGFTLVELSIVLVIIGLLIGGILVGQSLIESAKIQREVKKLSQYSIAFVQFYQKFNQEAGDSTYFTPPGLNWGITGYTSGGSTGCPGSDCRRPYYMAWGHLYQAGMISERFVYNDAETSIGNFVGSTPTHKLASGTLASNNT